MADEDMNDADVQRMAAELESEVSRALGSYVPPLPDPLFFRSST